MTALSRTHPLSRRAHHQGCASAGNPITKDATWPMTAKLSADARTERGARHVNDRRMKLGWVLAAVAASVSSLVIATPAQAQECREPRLMIVLDKSSSMQTGTIGAQTKWQ